MKNSTRGTNTFLVFVVLLIVDNKSVVLIGTSGPSWRQKSDSDSSRIGQVIPHGTIVVPAKNSVVLVVKNSAAR